MKEQILNNIIQKTLNGRRIPGVVVRLENGAGTFEWEGAVGNLQRDTPYFIASTTKLYTASLIFQLIGQGRLTLRTPLNEVLAPQMYEGIHCYRGVDFSPTLTVAQLLQQTSGLADYFQGKSPSGRPLAREVLSGKDQAWSFEQVLHSVRNMSPAFAPDTPGRALYSDTNYQLLGKIIEQLSGRSYAEVLEQNIIQPLGLNQTWLYQDADDARPATMNYQNHPVHIPQAMASFKADGGIVSTAAETMRFLRAYFAGELFPAELILRNGPWNRIFFPLQYGPGMMRFQLPRIFSPFRPLPELIGHSGLSGAFAFYCPGHDLYLTGSVNQIDRPGTAYKMMLKLIDAYARAE